MSTTETVLPSRPVNVSVAFVGGVATIEWDYVGSGDDGSALFYALVSDGGDPFVFRTTSHKVEVPDMAPGLYTTWVCAETSYGHGPLSYPVSWEVGHPHVGFN